jgi:Domain of unknown function (DUF4440)
MRYSPILILALFCGSAVATLGQSNLKSANLEKTLWDADQQWLCISPPYSKPYKDCVAFRSKYWADQFFEVSNTGRVQTKAEMVAAQTAANPPTGVGAYPADFNLIAVYGNFAVATDHTDFKTEDANGKVDFTSDSRVLRLFVMEGGQWQPAAAALVPVIPAKPAASAQQSNSGIRKSPDQIRSFSFDIGNPDPIQTQTVTNVGSAFPLCHNGVLPTGGCACGGRPILGWAFRSC